MSQPIVLVVEDHADPVDRDDVPDPELGFRTVQRGPHEPLLGFTLRRHLVLGVSILALPVAGLLLHRRERGFVRTILRPLQGIMPEGECLFCGMLVYPARRLSARTLALLGVVLMSVAMASALLAGFSWHSVPDEFKTAWQQYWQPSSGEIAEETAGAAHFTTAYQDGSHLAFVSSSRDHQHAWMRVADAATVDLRGDRVLPFMLEVIGDPGGDRLGRAVDLLDEWQQEGAHRRDLDGDGEYEHAAAVALMDEWWDRALEAAFRPALREAFDDVPLARDDPPGPVGSAYITGWYGHLQKDLRSVLGRPVEGPFSRQYCGDGDGPAACRTALLASLDAAMSALEERFGEDPAAWDADEEGDFIRFTALGVQPAQVAGALRGVCDGDVRVHDQVGLGRRRTRAEVPEVGGQPPLIAQDRSAGHHGQSEFRCQGQPAPDGEQEHGRWRDAGFGGDLCLPAQILPDPLDLERIVVLVQGGPPERAPDRGGEAQRPAQTQVDPARVQRLQQQRLLGDHQRVVVGHHDPAGAQADAVGAGADGREQHGGGGAGDARDRVVLGGPEPVEAQFVRAHRPLDGGRDRVRVGLPVARP